MAAALKSVRVEGKTYTLGSFAREMGKAMGRVDSMRDLSVSEGWHKAYSAMKDDEDRKLVFREWQVEFIAGRLGLGARDAVAVFEQTKGEREEDAQAAYAAGSMQFLYHVKRTGSKAKGKKRKGQKTVKAAASVKPAQRKAAMAFCAEFEGESLDEQVKAAMAVLAALLK